MNITKETFEAMLILLFKLEYYDSCEELLNVYKELFSLSKEGSMILVEHDRQIPMVFL